MTTVVNVRARYIRPQYNNLKEWTDDPNNVYIGRRGIVFIDGKRFPESDSIWANPFKVGKDGDIDHVLTKYHSYIVDKLEYGEIPTSELQFLKGKNLGCWCAPNRCHGDIVKFIVDLCV